MKKTLQFFVLLCVSFVFGQTPVVSNPILLTANDNSLSIRTTILANGAATFSIIYSEDAFFSPSVTWYANNVTTLPPSTPTNVDYTIPCLNSGDNYYVKVSVTNANGTTTSGYTTMSTTGPVINNYPKLNTFSFTNLQTTSARLNFNIDNNLNLPVTGTLYYGLSPTTMTSQVPMPTTNTDNAITFVDLTGLTPNTTYYSRVNLTNGTNCTSSDIRQFTTAMNTTLLYHFPFDGNRNSVTVNPGSFTNGAGFATYSNDDLGNATGALQVAVSNDDTSRSLHSHTANLPLLPQGNSSKSIAFRIKYLNASITHYVVSWGTGTNNQSYGFEKSPTAGSSAVWGNNVNFSNNTVANVWYNVVITYNGTTGIAEYFVNGSLVGSSTHFAFSSINTTGTNIVIGRSLAATFGQSNLLLDDLKIYAGVLSTTQIAALSTSDFKQNNLQFSMFPNPTEDVVSIDMEKEVKSVTVYSLQGQMVLTTNSNTFSVAALKTGVYFVRVEDADGAVATQKLIKK